MCNSHFAGLQISSLKASVTSITSVKGRAAQFINDVTQYSHVGVTWAPCMLSYPDWCHLFSPRDDFRCTTPIPRPLHLQSRLLPFSSFVRDCLRLLEPQMAKTDANEMWSLTGARGLRPSTIHKESRAGIAVTMCSFLLLLCRFWLCQKPTSCQFCKQSIQTYHRCIYRQVSMQNSEEGRLNCIHVNGDKHICYQPVAPVFSTATFL